MEYYLYRHIREDKNEPFYIGISKKNYRYNTYFSMYKRAYDKRRNNLWLKVFNKSKTYTVEIIFETDSYEEILKKEIEFIKLYGRIDLNTGTLANLTDGGEGVTNSTYIHTAEHNIKKSLGLMGHKISKESKKRMRDAKLGKKLTEEHKRKLNLNSKRTTAKRCIHIETSEEFESLMKGCINFGYKYSGQRQAIRRGNSTAKFKFL